MSDLKTERLINLTMALLATKRLLTKEEIFTSVAGYSGTQDSMERMFERDKDDLRKMGIEIEVAPIDPFFEDELGYRISPQKYSLEIPDFSPAEFAVLSLAGQSWRNKALSSQSQRALRKLESIGIEIDDELLANPVIALDSSTIEFEILWQAILEKREIHFDYEGRDIVNRRLYPYGLSLFKGEWYLTGFDLDRDAQRIFKVRRMNSIELVGKAGVFDIPDDFDIAKFFRDEDSEAYLMVRLKVRNGKGYSIRQRVEQTAPAIQKLDSDWDLVQLNYVSQKEALHEILWHGPDVICLEPQFLVESIVSILTERSTEKVNG